MLIAICSAAAVICSVFSHVLAGVVSQAETTDQDAFAGVTISLMVAGVSLALAFYAGSLT